MSKPSDAMAHAALRTLIAWIGDDPDRAGLIETPERVLRAWRETWGNGYNLDPTQHIKLFSGYDADPPTTTIVYDEMVIMKGAKFYATCEHHLCPFFGTATIAYLPHPERGILGASKMVRILDAFSRRLTIQERIANDVANFMHEHVSSLGCGIVLKGTHMCMASRGVNQSEPTMITSALRGVFFNNRSTRDEFLRIAME
jgi:GTP cyclohydrolase I